MHLRPIYEVLIATSDIRNKVSEFQNLPIWTDDTAPWNETVEPIRSNKLFEELCPADNDRLPEWLPNSIYLDANVHDFTLENLCLVESSGGSFFVTRDADGVINSLAFVYTEERVMGKCLTGVIYTHCTGSFLSQFKRYVLRCSSEISVLVMITNVSEHHLNDHVSSAMSQVAPYRQNSYFGYGQMQILEKKLGEGKSSD